MISSPLNPKPMSSDIDAMASILADHPALHWTRAMLEDSLNHPQCISFCDRDRRSFAIFQAVADEAELLLIATATDQQGRGYATRLLKNALTQLRAQGIRHIFLEVRAGNKAARHFYEKLGFSPSGLRRNYYQDPPEDALNYRISVT